MSDENSIDQGQILLYQTEDGLQRIEVRLEQGTVWLSQILMAELFQTTVANINLHVKNIYAEKEVAIEGTIKQNLIVRQEGNRKVQRTVVYYSLDMILAVGFRVRSHRGVQFRQWAAQRLKEYIIKGFTLDVAFAGLCFINDGKIKKSVTYSGHYSPTKKEQRSFFDQLSKICVVALDRPQCLIGIIHFFKPRSLEEIEIDEQKGMVQKISMYSYQKVTELYDKVSQVTGYCRSRLHLIAAGEDLSKGTTLEKTVMIKSGCIVSAFESRYAPYHPIVPVQHFKLMVIEPQFKDLDQF